MYKYCNEAKRSKVKYSVCVLDEIITRRTYNFDFVGKA